MTHEDVSEKNVLFVQWRCYEYNILQYLCNWTCRKVNVSQYVKTPNESFPSKSLLAIRIVIQRQEGVLDFTVYSFDFNFLWLQGIVKVIK